MKKFLTTFLISLLLIPLHAVSAERDFIKSIGKDLNLERYSRKTLSDDHARVFSSFVFTVLSNTQELHIHRMNGEATNEVFIRDEGQEAVFRFEHDEYGNRIDATGALVTDCLNMGSFNYHHPYTAPLRHFAADILPWLVLGNCREDPSTLDQRVESYMLDFKEGYARVLQGDAEFFLPNGFRFREAGQSEAVAFFAKALETAGFDFTDYFLSGLTNAEKQEELFDSLERGIKELIRKYNKVSYLSEATNGSGVMNA